MNNKIDQKRSFAKEVTVKSEFGIHARPAAKISQMAKNAKQNVWLINNSNKADATSIIDILALYCTAKQKIGIFGNPAKEQ